MPASEKTPKKAKKASTKGSTAKRSAPQKRSATKKPASASASTPAGKAGDLILIESEKVGSPPREGEVLEVVHGQVSISYLVRWTDGHQSLIAPGAGNTRIVPTRTKR
jgi:uncharacterized protein DUF1918